MTWQLPHTAPENGDDFWYFARGEVLIGCLSSDCGGTIIRDRDMVAWHPKLQWYESGAEVEQPPSPPDIEIQGLP